MNLPDGGDAEERARRRRASVAEHLADPDRPRLPPSEVRRVLAEVRAETDMTTRTGEGRLMPEDTDRPDVTVSPWMEIHPASSA